MRVVVTDVAEADVGGVRVGDPVDLTVPAFSGRRFSGTVTSVPLMATTGSTTYAVQVTVSGSPRQLLPGMTANVVIITAQARNVTVVPATAIHATTAGTFVDTLDRHNRIARVRVRTGIGDSQYTQILAGLRPGQLILLRQPIG
jgi:multidrug efflux pump subunit AcrA (membrane-fusion protein)